MAIQFDSGGNHFAALDDFDGSRILAEDWRRNDPNGQEFAAKFNTPTSIQKLADVLNLHNLPVSCRNLSWVYQRLRDSGQLASPQPSTEPDVPRDRNGKPLSESQIAWGEMVRWSESASSNEIHLRRQNDPAYRQFYSTNLKNEMTVPIDGAALEPVALGPAPYVDEGGLQRLKHFARDFNLLPTREARNKFLVAFNPDYKDFARDFDFCCRLRLL